MLPRFIKMHGCGNDFVILDERREPLGLTPATIAAVADRRTGVGCDQVITLHYAPDDSNADIMIRFFNSDGSEAGACGNGTRCAAALFHAETASECPDSVGESAGAGA
jgi:diaminopimelate epimerase